MLGVTADPAVLVQLLSDNGKQFGGLTHLDVTGWNPQCLHRKLHKVDRHLRSQIVGCPGTMWKNNTPGFQEDYWVSESAKYIWINHPPPPKATKHSNNSCGCSVGLWKKLFNSDCIKDVWTSAEIGTSYQGRGLIVELKKRGLYHVCMVVLYFPLERGPDDTRLFTKMLDWAGCIIRGLAARCSVFFAVDNVKVGKLRGLMPRSGDPVGPYGAEWNRTTPHGFLFRSWCMDLRLTITSTHLDTGNHPTYYQADGRYSRPDLLGASLELEPEYGRVLQKIGFLMQSSRLHRNVDHVPTKIRYAYSLFFDAECIGRQKRPNVDKIMMAWTKGTNHEGYLDCLRTEVCCREEDFMAEIEQANPTKAYAILLECMATAAQVSTIGPAWQQIQQASEG